MRTGVVLLELLLLVHEDLVESANLGFTVRYGLLALLVLSLVELSFGTDSFGFLQFLLCLIVD